MIANDQNNRICKVNGNNFFLYLNNFKNTAIDKNSKNFLLKLDM